MVLWAFGDVYIRVLDMKVIYWICGFGGLVNYVMWIHINSAFDVIYVLFFEFVFDAKCRSGVEFYGFKTVTVEWWHLHFSCLYAVRYHNGKLNEDIYNVKKINGKITIMKQEGGYSKLKEFNGMIIIK